MESIQDLCPDDFVKAGMSVGKLVDSTSPCVDKQAFLLELIRLGRITPDELNLMMLDDTSSSCEGASSSSPMSLFAKFVLGVFKSGKYSRALSDDLGHIFSRIKVVLFDSMMELHMPMTHAISPAPPPTNQKQKKMKKPKKTTATKEEDEKSDSKDKDATEDVDDDGEHDGEGSRETGDTGGEAVEAADEPKNNSGIKSFDVDLLKTILVDMYAQNEDGFVPKLSAIRREYVSRSGVEDLSTLISKPHLKELINRIVDEIVSDE